MPQLNHHRSAQGSLESSYTTAESPPIDEDIDGSSCPACTFINKPSSALCAMCEQFIGPPAHTIHSDGSWSCGSCDHHNENGMHECYYCDAPYVSAVASAVPLTIFCSRCGVRNSGTAGACISCNHTLLSRLESLKHEWTDTANFVARDLGLHVQVRCPGCMTVCAVPASACFRCGACHTCFAAPTVGDVTSFHVARLTRSLSSSVRSLFHTSDHPPPPPRPRSKPTALNQSFFQRFFQPSDSTDESDDDKPLFGSPRRNPPPSSVDNTRTIPVGIRLPQTPHVHRTDSHGVEYMHLPPPPSRQVPVHVMDSYVAPRKSDAIPTAFERDWDLRRLSLSAEEAKQELDDDDDVLALTVSHTGGIHVSHAHTVHF